MLTWNYVYDDFFFIELKLGVDLVFSALVNLPLRASALGSLLRRTIICCPLHLIMVN